MSNQVTLGGDRLGSGKKEKISLHGYERSTFDLSYVWRSTMASGTLVPFMVEVGLPGDTFDIDLNCDVKTHPTIGPLFGSFKVQLDVFSIPWRLFNGKVQMNMVNIGNNMGEVKIPQLRLGAARVRSDEARDNQQVNPSCILKYLGISGIGQTNSTDPDIKFYRNFNALPYLSYWEIYKQYYSNKQEENGMFINHPYQVITSTINEFLGYVSHAASAYEIPASPSAEQERLMRRSGYIRIGITNYQNFAFDRIGIVIDGNNYPITEIFADVVYDQTIQCIYGRALREEWVDEEWKITGYTFDKTPRSGEVVEPKLQAFRLENIDKIRMQILQAVAEDTAYELDYQKLSPYGPTLDSEPVQENGEMWAASAQNQQGLAVKTYQSDLFNNWISTEWLDGDNGVNAITAIDTSTGSFTIDQLNLSNKIFNLLNRIALSGGTYYDWLNATYDHGSSQLIQSPVYVGGLIKELVFQEVVSTSNSGEENPLGELAGRGTLGKKHKGGKIRVTCNEPSYIMGIVSLTPRVDYSQGNRWDVNLKTWDDLYKPALGQIGFQDLITDKIAWWNTTIDFITGEPIFYSVGKQPAWIDYMTNYNRVYGNFADETQQMFMVLNRRYEATDLKQPIGIKDLTTYIDPAKFNYIFADTRRDAQNFWTQIAVDMTARRKMTSKVIPNL